MTHIRYSNLSYRDNNSPQTQKPRGKYLGLVCLIIVGLLVIKVGLVVNNAQKVSALEAARQHSVAAQNFKQTVYKIIAANPQVDWAVSVADLDYNSNQDLGDTNAMDAASVGKLLSAMLYFHKVELGQAKLTQNINSNSASYELKQLINQSDDNAWLAFNSYLGHPALTSYADQLGLSTYDSNSNSISTADVARVLQMLYQGKLLNAQHTKQLLAYMQHTNYEDFITPAVPSGDQIFHKVGLDDDEVNDAAVITDGHQSLVLVIFTNGNGVQDWAARASLMQQITTAALNDYF